MPGSRPHHFPFGMFAVGTLVVVIYAGLISWFAMQTWQHLAGSLGWLAQLIVRH